MQVKSTSSKKGWHVKGNAMVFKRYIIVCCCIHVLANYSNLAMESIKFNYNLRSINQLLAPVETVCPCACVYTMTMLISSVFYYQYTSVLPTCIIIEPVDFGYYM